MSGLSLPPSTTPSTMATIAEELGSVRALHARIEETAKLKRARERLPNSNLDVPAAARFIAAGLGGGTSSDVARPVSLSGSAQQHTVESSESASGAGSAETSAPPPARDRGSRKPQGGSASRAPEAAQFVLGAKAGPAPPTQRSASDGSHRSTPTPALAHANWQKDLEKVGSNKRSRKA